MTEDKLNNHTNYNVCLSELKTRLENEVQKRTVNVMDMYNEFKMEAGVSEFSDDNVKHLGRMLKIIQLERRLIKSTERIMNCEHNILATEYSCNDGEEYRCTKCGLWAKKYHSGELELLW